MPFQLEETTIADLQSMFASGQLTAHQLTSYYLQRIEELDKQGPTLNAVIETNPDALTIAQELDQERARQGARGPLHGIPVLLKDNIATTDRMQTTAGSLALLNSRPAREAIVVSALREAGTVIIGKANMSEWANFRSSESSSGWSARGGQAHNPYVLDRSPCGSSSGSASAVAANLVAVSLGTETDGSILCPAGMCGVVGIKPTLDLISSAGVVPIAHSQDVVGPLTRTVADAAIMLTALIATNLHTPPSPEYAHFDYTKSLDTNGLQGARIGVSREVYFGYNEKLDRVIEVALKRLEELGATLIDPANIPTAKQMSTSEHEQTVLLHEFKADLNTYLADLAETPVRTLEEIIAFNEAHTDEEMPYFGQDIMVQAQKTDGLENADYLHALEENRRMARQEGIDAVMNELKLDALVMPTVGPGWCNDHINGDHFVGSSSQPIALAGYPGISVPAGFVSELPVGLTFIGRAFSEATLIKLAYAFEQGTHYRRVPKFIASLR